jgi:LytR cell envelope-related transcriptional attenuator
MTALPLALSLSSTFTKIGAIAAFAALLGIALLSLLVFSQAREIKRLREWAGRAPERAADMEQRVSAAAASRLQQGQPQAVQAVRPAPVAASAVGPATRVAGAPVAGAPPGQAVTAAGVPVAPAVPGVPLPPQPAQPSTVAQPQPVPAGSPALPAGQGAPLTPASPPPAAVPAQPASAPVGAPASAAGAAAPSRPAAEGTPAGTPNPRPPAPATAAAAAAAAVTPAVTPRAPAPPRPSAPAATEGQPPQAAARRPPAPAAPAAVRRADARAPILAEARRSNYVAERSPRRKVLLIAGGLVAIAAVVAVVALTVLGGSSGKKASTSSLTTTAAKHGSKVPRKAAHKTASTHVNTPAVSPAETTVAVLNATEAEGLAHRTAEQLQQSGYSQAAALSGKPPGSGQVSVVEYASGHKAEAEGVAHSAEVTQVQPMESAVAALASSANVVLIVGEDKATQSP